VIRLEALITFFVILYKVLENLNERITSFVNVIIVQVLEKKLNMLM
jgi:hypothetical protein